MKRLALLALLLLPLAGCSRDGQEDGVAEAATPTRAVAKGVVEAEGGLVRVLAPRDGIVVSALVQEGDRVAAGQDLARLDDRQARLLLDAAGADVAERRSEADVAAAKAVGAEREAARLGRLAAVDAAPRQDADQAAAAAAVARGEQRQAQAAAGAAAARQRLSAFEVGVREIRSPTAGRVVRRTTATGAYASAAAPLYVIEPDGPRTVRAELDEAFADRVRPGMDATVTREFQSGDALRVKVVRVADVLAGPALADDATSRPDARVITVTLALPPNSGLRVGQRVLVRFGP